MKYSITMLAVACALTSAPVRAQTGTITGTVTDRETKQPLEGVQVVIQGTSYGFKTRANGKYSILGVPPNTYTLVAQLAGYARVDVTGVSVMVDVTRNQDIVLSSGGYTRSPTLPIVEPGTMATSARQPTTTPGEGTDPFSRCLIPPELIMSHQAEINLSDGQRNRIIDEMSSAQKKFTTAQWTLSGEQQRLEQLLSAAPIDEPGAMRQLDKIMTLEQDVKRSQLALLVRVKNNLTANQIVQLLEVRWGNRPDRCGP